MKRLISCLCLLLLRIGYALQADEGVPLTRMAEAYADAGDYDQAIALYDKLEGQQLLYWQKIRITYNIGTIYLRQSKLDDAMRKFASIPPYQLTSPILNAALYHNMAVLDFLKEKELQLKTLDQYRQAVSLLRDALHEEEASATAPCALQEMEGFKTCSGISKNSEFRAELKDKVGVLLKAMGEAKISLTPAIEGVPLLLAGVKRMLSHIDFLTAKPMQENLKSKYIELFLEDGESWLLFWEAQREKLPLLDDAAEQYRSGLHNLAERHFESSRLAFLSAASKLSDLMHKLWGENPVLEQLRNLLITYQTALDQFPSQTAMLYQIQLEQMQLKSILDTNESREVFSQAEKDLASSLEFSRSVKNVEARFFLLISRHEVQSLAKGLVKNGSKTPDLILQDGIEEQVYSNSLAALMKEIKGDQGMYDAIKQAQSNTLEVVAPFIKAVLQKEKEDYPHRCQHKPWDKVIPLFEQGIDFARMVQEKLGGTFNILQVIQLQEETINTWRQALELLRKPLTEEDKYCEEGRAQSPASQAQTQPQQGAPAQNVLSQLMQMYREDRQPLPENAPLQKVEKPW